MTVAGNALVLPAQKVVPDGQVHRPETHDCPSTHGLPQPPQLFVSDWKVLGSTHLLRQYTCPLPGQVHLPPEQVEPSLQALKHAPQFALSLCKSVHCLLQNAEAVEGQVHRPPEQDWPPVQTVLHLPQFKLSVKLVH